jgi:glycosyltransferase involved in cell wall biosynthesis
MGLLDTMVHGETAYLARIAEEIRVQEAIVGDESGAESGRRVVFDNPRVVDYRASIHDIARYLLELMQNAELRRLMGQAGRKRAAENYSFRVIARRFVQIIGERFGLS